MTIRYRFRFLLYLTSHDLSRSLKLALFGGIFCGTFGLVFLASKSIGMQWRRKVPKSVCVCGGGGGELYLDVWLFTNIHLCQFIEIVHKIINWYMKNAK